MRSCRVGDSRHQSRDLVLFPADHIRSPDAAEPKSRQAPVPVVMRSAEPAAACLPRATANPSATEDLSGRFRKVVVEANSTMTPEQISNDEAAP